jgi:hypothetical protein
MRSFCLGVALAAAPVLSAGAQAEIVQKSDQGFVVGAEVDVPGKTPLEVWPVLIAPATWWNPVHSWSGDAANLYLDPQAGGCFCELLPKPKGAPDNWRRGSIEHMRVIAAMPPKLLRLSGALGPLQGEALVATLTVTLRPLPDGGTHLTWSYIVSGYMRMKADEIVPLVDKVLVEQFTRMAKAAQLAPVSAAGADTPDENHH